MGKYAEEIYDRAEKQFSSVEAQIGWLASFEEKTGAYAEDAVFVASKLQESKEIEKNIISTRRYDDLEALKKDVDALPPYIQTDLLAVIETKQQKIEERKADIQNDFDKIKDLSDLDNVKKRLKNIRDEIDVSDLDTQIEEIRMGLEKQRKDNRIQEIKRAIDNAQNSEDIRNAERRIESLRKDEENVSELERQLKNARNALGEAKRQAKQSQRTRIEERGEGASPDF